MIYIYTASLDGINDVFKDTIQSGGSWASKIASIEGASKEKLTSLVEAIRDKAE